MLPLAPRSGGTGNGFESHCPVERRPGPLPSVPEGSEKNKPEETSTREGQAQELQVTDGSRTITAVSANQRALLLLEAWRGRT